MGDFTRVKSPMKIHGRFYLSKKTPDYKMTHQLFTLFWIISNILTFHFYTFSVIYTFYFYIAFEELTFYQKCSIKCVLYSLFYTRTVFPWGFYKSRKRLGYWTFQWSKKLLQYFPPYWSLCTFLVSSSAQLINFLLKLVIPSTSASRVNLERLMMSLLPFVFLTQEGGIDLWL